MNSFSQKKTSEKLSRKLLQTSLSTNLSKEDIYLNNIIRCRYSPNYICGESETEKKYCKLMHDHFIFYYKGKLLLNVIGQIEDWTTYRISGLNNLSLDISMYDKILTMLIDGLKEINLKKIKLLEMNINHEILNLVSKKGFFPIGQIIMENTARLIMVNYLEDIARTKFNDKFCV